MAVHVVRTRRDGYVLEHMTGTVDRAWIERSKQTLEERWRACQEAGVGGIVVDVRESTMAIDIGDRYDLAVMYAESPMAAIRVAILGKEEQTTPDRFFQKVAANRGVQLRVFVDEGEAIAWARG